MSLAGSSLLCTVAQLHCCLPNSSNVFSVAYLMCLYVVNTDAFGSTNGDAAVVLVESYVQQSLLVATAAGQ